MKLSIIIPARNEEDCLEHTVLEVIKELEKEKIENEIVIVNDNSTDRTKEIPTPMATILPRSRNGGASLKVECSETRPI